MADVGAAQPPPVASLPPSFRDPNAKMEELGGGAWKVTVDKMIDGVPGTQTLVMKQLYGQWKIDIDVPRLAQPFENLSPDLQNHLKAMFEKNSVTYNKLVDLSELMTLIRKLTSDINKAASDMKGELMLLNAALAKEEKNLKIKAAQEDVKAAKQRLAGAMVAMGTAIAGATVSFGMTAAAARRANSQQKGLNQQKNSLESTEGTAVDKYNNGNPPPIRQMERGKLTDADQTRMKQLGRANDDWGNQDLDQPNPLRPGEAPGGRVEVDGQEYRPGNALGRERSDLEYSVKHQKETLDANHAEAQKLADTPIKTPEQQQRFKELVGTPPRDGEPGTPGKLQEGQQKLEADQTRLFRLNEAEATYAQRAGPVPIKDSEGNVIPGESFEPGGQQSNELGALKARDAHAEFTKSYDSQIATITQRQQMTVQLGQTLSQTLNQVGSSMQAMLDAQATIMTAEAKATFEAQAMMAATQRQNNNELMSSLAGEEGKFDQVMQKMFELAERAWSVSSNIGTHQRS